MDLSSALTVVAHAKINVGLEVVGRRPDGYHNVVTILQEIALSDRLSFWDGPGLTLVSDKHFTAPESNLILRAAQELQRALAVDRGAVIRLEKSIPIGGGLGGGSSDAAATLRGLTQLWRLGGSHATLVDLARSLGSDVPFFLRGGTQLAQGRGDELIPLPTPKAWVVVVDVGESLPNKTHALYAALRPTDFSDGERTRAVAASLQNGEPLRAGDLVNAFERPALELFGGVRRAFEAVRAAGVRPLLAGAGPTVVSIHHDESTALNVADRLRRSGHLVAIAPTISTSRWSLSEQSPIRNNQLVRLTEGA